MHILLLILCCSSTLFIQLNPKDELVAFDWKYRNALFATIRIPPGFTEETEDYREGIITYLRYPDGSYIVLHRGHMWKTPFFEEPKYRVTEKKEEFNEQKYLIRLFRKGTIKNTDLYWREENLFFKWPPLNIGFERVTKDRVDLFNKALDSFVYKSSKGATEQALGADSP